MQQISTAFGRKAKGFSFSTVLIRSSLKKVLVGTAGVTRSTELQNFMAAKLKVNKFLRFASGCLISITGHLIGVKNRVNYVLDLFFI